MGSLTRMDFLNQLAWELALLDPPRSRALCKEALRLARGADYQLGIAAAVRTQAYDCLVKTRLRRALTLGRGARNLFRELGDRYGYATATDITSNCYNYIGNYERGAGTRGRVQRSRARNRLAARRSLVAIQYGHDLYGHRRR